MSVIGMIGPHAVGKTTALARWTARYGSLGLQTFSLDAQRKEFPGNEEKRALVGSHRCPAPEVVVVESARGFAGWVGYLSAGDPLIVLTCPEPVGRAWMMERKPGKPLSDYWTPKRLDYECNGHLLNYVRKHTGHMVVKHFVIEDRERDWPAVDEYFAKIFKALHNRGVRARVQAEAGSHDPLRQPDREQLPEVDPGI